MFDIIILTIFPKYYEYFTNHSIIKNAQQNNLIKIKIIDFRKYSDDNFHVDDSPYGGGPGMVLKCEPIVKAINNLDPDHLYHRIYMSPQGKILNNEIIKKLSQKEKIFILVGNYEGIDERILDYIDEEISIGNFVLTGGELASMILVDTVARFIPNVIKQDSLKNDSFYNKILDHSHYTKPRIFQGKKVPDILLSGDHKKIQEWRENSALLNTYKKRKDLLTKKQLEKIKLDLKERNK